MKVLLTALSAKNIHKALAPWCLKAYCDAHVPGCEIQVQEHTANDPVAHIVAAIYESKPDLVGFSCYIWNIEQTVKLARMLKKYLPTCLIVLGGPEVSFEVDGSAYPFADLLIQGAGEKAFADLLRDLQTGKFPQRKVIKSSDDFGLDEKVTPYTVAYFNSFAEGPMLSIKNQLVYYESSRGCPFSCAYCLSSTVRGVKELPISRVRSDLDELLKHGATCVKFVDRTFNANKSRAREILQYIASLETDCTFHFEVAADLFDPELLALIAALPRERVQFEIGIQSTHDKTLTAIHRRMDVEGALQNIEPLLRFENCHVHVDLIAGLPFETLSSFAKGVDACMKPRPHMLQLGFLKLLKGTELREKSETYGYVFSDFPPYEVFRSAHMGFEEILRLKQIEEVLDKFYNSGMFANAMNYAMAHVFQSPYACLEALSVVCRGVNLRVSLKHAYTILFRFLCEHMERAAAEHYIKLDCFTFSGQGVLPDDIPIYRDKTAEHDWKRTTGSKHSNIRVEYFEYDKKTRVFIYDEKDELRKSYKIVLLSENENPSK